MLGIGFNWTNGSVKSLNSLRLFDIHDELQAYLGGKF